jgi:hypothetical protein
MQTEKERVTRKLPRKNNINNNNNNDTCKEKKGQRSCTNRKRGETAEKKKTKISHTERGGKKNLKQGNFTSKTKTKTSRRRLLENKRQGSRSSEVTMDSSSQTKYKEV